MRGVVVYAVGRRGHFLQEGAVRFRVAALGVAAGPAFDRKLRVRRLQCVAELAVGLDHVAKRLLAREFLVLGEHHDEALRAGRRGLADELLPERDRRLPASGVGREHALPLGPEEVHGADREPGLLPRRNRRQHVGVDVDAAEALGRDPRRRLGGRGLGKFAGQAEADGKSTGAGKGGSAHGSFEKTDCMASYMRFAASAGGSAHSSALNISIA